MAQHGQQLPARWQRLGHGDPRLFEFAAQPSVLGLLGSFLAEPFGVVVEGAMPPGRGEQLVHGAGVAFELGQDGQVLQGQVPRQRLNAGPGLTGQGGGGQSGGDLRRLEPGGLADPGLGGPGLPGGEQGVGLLQRRERVAVPVGDPHVQQLAGLVASPVTGQVDRHLGQASLDRSGETAVPVDHPVAAVGAGGDAQRHQDAVLGDRGKEPGAEVQVAADVTGVRGEQADRDHRPRQARRPVLEGTGRRGATRLANVVVGRFPAGTVWADVGGIGHGSTPFVQKG
jgi:hypothetical protein